MCSILGEKVMDGASLELSFLRLLVTQWAPGPQFTVHIRPL